MTPELTSGYAEFPVVTLWDGAEELVDCQKQSAFSCSSCWALLCFSSLVFISTGYLLKEQPHTPAQAGEQLQEEGPGASGGQQDGHEPPM